jgi:hypothetical protein
MAESVPSELRFVYPFLYPEAYYRIEIGTGLADKHGRRRLDKQADCGNCPAYTLWGQTSAATSGCPKTMPGPRWAPPRKWRIRWRVARCGEAGTVNAQVLRFFDEYFRLP